MPPRLPIAADVFYAYNIVYAAAMPPYACYDIRRCRYVDAAIDCRRLPADFSLLPPLFFIFTPFR